MMPKMNQFYLNREAIISFTGDRIRLTLPSSRKTIYVDAATMQLLSALCDRSDEQLRALKESFTEESLIDAIEQLVKEGVLTPDAKASRASTMWDDWGEITWAFHLMTKDTKFAVTDEERLASALLTSQTEPPSRYKCTCCDTSGSVQLSTPRHIRSGAFSQVLLNRRTCRSYANTKLELGDVSDLLFYSGGVLFENDTKYYGIVLKKSAPSPGARHATEIYAAIQGCSAVEVGIYHYCVKHHKLNLVTAFAPQEFFEEALINQPYFANAPIVVFFTTVVDRLMWKYKTPRIYRLAHFEVAHYCQNFLLVGTALGLGVFSTAALADSKVEQALGIDGVGEFLMYAAGAGFEQRSERNSRRGVSLSANLPNDFRPKLPLIEPGASQMKHVAVD